MHITGMVPLRKALLAITIPSLWFLRAVSSRSVNHTIDDQFGDEVTGQMVLYGGNQFKVGNGCIDCFEKPDSTLAYHGSWHDASFVPGPPITATFTFSGTAVYVFFILSNNEGDDLPRYLYNVSAFSRDGIEDGEHTVTITLRQSSGPGTLLLFDYAIYTRNEPDPEPDPSPSAPLPFPTASVETSPPLLPSQRISHAVQSTHVTQQSATNASTTTLSGSQTLLTIRTTRLTMADPPTPIITDSLSSVTPKTPDGDTYHLSHRSMLPVIVGATASGLILVVLAVIIWYLCRVRRRRRNGKEPCSDTNKLSIQPDPDEDTLVFGSAVSGQVHETEPIISQHRPGTPVMKWRKHPSAWFQPPTTSTARTNADNAAVPARISIRGDDTGLAVHGGRNNLPIHSSLAEPAPTIQSGPLTREELARLRAEVMELRTQQYPLQRELLMMRMELQDMRGVHQEPLPEYSPPPSRP
ncbi:hypothetical protein BXZ70DRAFT_1006614 [Cristinia sonorae]|uniref:Uncharacterized protein n=1 Tax=Cristinia sonorae TaxID=1940300 RepID=A0A8K0US06_9AGAR|nr:hypothetical protein BXZ70DRAFT_1006614 [Cristinia sonorae]